MAEREGFEPSVRFKAHTRFPSVLFKPLRHLSEQRRKLHRWEGESNGLLCVNPPFLFIAITIAIRKKDSILLAHYEAKTTHQTT